MLFGASSQPHDANDKMSEEITMPTQDHGRIVETTVEARGAETGRPTRNVLVISTIAVIVVLAIVWYVFFRT
jgi:hypothetical protein